MLEERINPLFFYIVKILIKGTKKMDWYLVVGTFFLNYYISICYVIYVYKGYIRGYKKSVTITFKNFLYIFFFI